MSDRLTDEERRALLAGDGADALEPDEAAELGFLADVLADPSMWAEPDLALEDKVMQAVANAPAIDATSTTSQPIPIAQRRGTVGRPRRIMLASLAAAASIALVVGVLVATGTTASPDYQGQLTATALAPGARASAEVTRNAAGFRVTVDAHGLRPLRAGAFYQAWLKNASGGLVSIGTFSSSDGAITLWSGVSPQQYRGISVTIEPDNGDPASSGRRVLTGELRAN